MNSTKRLTKTLLLGGLLAGISVFVAPQPAHAADDIGLTLSPVSKNYTFDAGTTNKDSIKIINTGTTTYTFKVYGKPFFVNNTDYSADFSSTRSNADVYKWLKFEQTSYRIAPQQTVVIPYAISVPAGAAPGAHYGVIFAEADPPKQELAGQSGVITSQRVGALLYATVNGHYRIGGAVKEQGSTFFQFNPPLGGKLAVENSGNADFMVQTKFVVEDIFGRIKYTQENEYRVLADTTRNMTFEWKTSPRFGLYRVAIESKFLDEHTTRAGYVLMLPVWTYLLTLLLLLAGIAYVVQKRR